MFKLASSIRTKVLLVVLSLLFVTSILVSSSQMYIMYRDVDHNAQESLKNEAAQVANHFDLWVTSIKNLGVTLTKQQDIKYGTFEQRQAMLETFFSSMPGFDALMLLDKNGIVINRYPYDAKRIGASNANYDYYKQAVATGQPQFGEISISKVSGKPIAIASYPVKDNNGQIIAVLIQSLNFDYIQSILKKINIGNGGMVTIVDSSGKMIYHSHDDVVGQPAPDALLGLINNSSNAIIKYESSVGTKSYGTVANILDTKWYVGISLPYAEVMNAFFSSLKVGFLMLPTILIIVSFLIWWMLKKLLHPISTIADHLIEIAKGRLNLGHIDVNSQDELGKLCMAVNQMVDNLRDIIKQVSQNAEQLAASSEELTASADQSAQAVTQVAGAINDISHGAEKSAKAVTETSVTIEKQSASIQQAAANANQVAENSSKAVISAKEGSKSVEKAISQMAHIELTVNNSAQLVSHLGERSQEIGQIVDTISGIAGQTNLLALNAAIEAARAGEHGRGFAVVAEEVRKLAEQSQDAAKQIADLINGIQEVTDKAVTAMNEGTREVKVGTEVVTMAGNEFKNIAATVERASERVKEISATIQQMTSGSQQIVTLMKEIDEQTKTTAGQSQTVSAATEEQSASMEQIAASSQSLAKLAQSLQIAVSKFQI